MESCKVIKHIASAMENGEYDFDGTPEKHVCVVIVHNYVTFHTLFKITQKQLACFH
jgi:hypothetical protein